MKLMQYSINYRLGLNLNPFGNFSINAFLQSVNESVSTTKNTLLNRVVYAIFTNPRL
jgi:hypothetical protein